MFEILFFLALFTMGQQIQAQDSAVKVNRTNLNLYCQGKPDGFFEHPDSCTSYLQCHGGVTTELTCQQCYEVTEVQAEDFGRGVSRRSKNTPKIKQQESMKRFWQKKYELDMKHMTTPKAATPKPKYLWSMTRSPFIKFTNTTPTTKSPGRSIDFQNTIPANAETNTTLVTNANTQLNSMEDEDPNTEATTVPVNCIRMVYSSVAGSCVEDQEMLCLEDGEGKRLTPPSSEPNMPLTSPEEDGSIAGSPPPE